MSVSDKLQTIFDTVKSIEEESPGVGTILMDGFALAISVIQQLPRLQTEKLDVSEQIKFISEVLSIDLEDVVKHIVDGYVASMPQGSNPAINFDSSSKEADKEALAFITSGVDDYEKFLKENDVEDNLSFLTQEIDKTLQERK